MIFDLNKNERKSSYLYDICIIGAGVAGITLAIELSKQGKKIALLEGGGEQYSEISQDIYKAENTGSTYYGVSACRLRYLGGTSNHWAGRTMLLQPVDFKERDFFSLTGWPIKIQELDRHRDEAFNILGLKKDSLDALDMPELVSSSMKSVGHGSTPPVRFREKYYRDLVKSKNIDLFINANLTDMKLNDSFNHISKLEVKNYNDTTYDFSGKKIILAMGAIENARLLLNCNSQLPAGVGNHSDFVGRCFMEHFQIQMGRYTINSSHPIWSKDTYLEFFPTDKFVLKNKIGTSVISFGKATSKSYGRLKAIRKFLKESVCTSESLTDFSRNMFNFNCSGDGIITTLCEQSPNKKSRITLSNEKDSLGLQRAVLNWDINELDKRTIRLLAIETAKEFARLDFGRVQLPDYILSDDVELVPNGHCHQMGTTRMAKSSEDGVVDVNCKVFGIDNLYVAGSSVFSTGGGVNPTLSIVQLSLRLAEHLSDINIVKS